MNKEAKQNNENINPGIAALFKAFRYVFAFLAFGIVFIIVYYFTFGGAFVVGQQERALVMNFGKLDDKVYGPGWHWNWPEPISEIVRIPCSRQTIDSTAFWFYIDPTKKFNKEDYVNKVELVPGQDGYLMTGDANIVHAQVVMHYIITSPRKYYENCITPLNPSSDDNVFINPNNGEKIGTRGPKTLLQSTLENSILKLCAIHTIDYAWKSPEFIAEVNRVVTAAIDRLDIGVTVENIAITDRQPPMGAYNAFKAVTEAEVKSQAMKHDAKNYAVKQRNLAESESAKIIANANIYSTEVVATIKSDAKTFKAILKEYQENPDTVPVALYSDTLSDVIESADDIFILRANKKGTQQLRILLNRDPAKRRVNKKIEQ